LDALHRDHVQARESDQNVTPIAVADTDADGSEHEGAPQHAVGSDTVEAFRGGLLGRSRSWKASTHLRRHLERVSLTPTAGTKSRKSLTWALVGSGVTGIEPAPLAWNELAQAAACLTVDGG
jgi:hypothetical protein